MSPPQSPPSRARRGRRRSGRRSFLWRFRRLLFVLALLFVGGLAAAAFVVARVPLPAEDVPGETTFLYDINGKVIASIHGGHDRVAVTLDQVPEVVVNAVLAAEDRDFFSHPGIDLSAIVRATWADIRAGGVAQGGSTITQQYVKNAYVGRERSIWRKLREAIIAVKLERKLDKEEILERYLNRIYFGRGASGVQAASRAYFAKDVTQLNLAEAAYLAGLIRAPEIADASRSRAAATGRRDRTLRLMEKAGFITARERDQAVAVPIEQMVTERRPGDEVVVADCDCGLEYFVDYVSRQLRDRYGGAAVVGGGLRVATTINLDMQRAAYRAVYGVLDQPGDPAGALVAVDELGHVKAMVGGRSFDESQVNYAVGREGGGTGRQAGSAFKPFVLAETVKQGYSVESAFESPSRVVFPDADNGKDYRVRNYDGAAHGRVNLIDGTRVSSNTVYAQLIDEVGPGNVANLAKRMGIRSVVHPVISLALGTSEVSVLDMAGAYMTFARRGEHIEPIAVTKVATADGRVLDEAESRRRRVLEPAEADVVNFVLRQVVEGGTGTAARFGRPAAGKTGTTQDYADAWFVGYTPRLAAAVWMGYPDARRPMEDFRGQQVTGGSFPADMWRRFMVAAARGTQTGSFVTPKSFRGQVLNARLPFGAEETTTTTAAESEVVEDTTPSSTTSTPSSTTSTPSTTPTSSTTSSTAPPDGGTSTSSSSTTTTSALAATPPRKEP